MRNIYQVHVSNKSLLKNGQLRWPFFLVENNKVIVIIYWVVRTGYVRAVLSSLCWINTFR